MQTQLVGVWKGRDKKCSLWNILNQKHSSRSAYPYNITGVQGDSAVHCKAIATAVSYCIYIFIASGNLQMVTGEKFPFFFVGFGICLQLRSDSLSAGKTEDCSPLLAMRLQIFVEPFPSENLFFGGLHSCVCDAVPIIGSCSSTLRRLCLLVPIH